MFLILMRGDGIEKKVTIASEEKTTSDENGLSCV